MKINDMDSFVYWYTQNIIHIIQFVSFCIGLVFIYFIYRLFFASSEAASDSADARTQVTSKQIADLDKKISKIIDHQSQPKSSEFTGEASEYEASAKAAGDVTSSDSHAMISQIQNEVEHLRKELESSTRMLSAKNAELNTVKEKLIEQQESASAVKASAATAGDDSLKAKINELEKKLQEYDIISDDIAELQNLRAENAELKSKASAG
jgi:hypothetical protein